MAGYHTFRGAAPTPPYLRAVPLPKVVRQVVLDLCDELLGVVGIETQNLPETFEFDVLQVAVGQGLHTGVGLYHFFLSQTVRTDQVPPTCTAEAQILIKM